MSTQGVWRDYKFAILFENAGVEGYLTERLLNAYLASSLTGSARSALRARFRTSAATTIALDLSGNIYIDGITPDRLLER